MYTVVHKNRTLHNETIFTIFAPLVRELNFQQNPFNISHFTSTLVPHYLGKFKIVICQC